MRLLVPGEQHQGGQREHEAARPQRERLGLLRPPLAEQHAAADDQVRPSDDGQHHRDDRDAAALQRDLQLPQRDGGEAERQVRVGGLHDRPDAPGLLVDDRDAADAGLGEPGAGPSADPVGDAGELAGVPAARAAVADQPHQRRDDHRGGADGDHRPRPGQRPGEGRVRVRLALLGRRQPDQHRREDEQRDARPLPGAEPLAEEAHGERDEEHQADGEDRLRDGEGHRGEGHDLVAEAEEQQQAAAQPDRVRQHEAGDAERAAAAQRLHAARGDPEDEEGDVVDGGGEQGEGGVTQVVTHRERPLGGRGLGWRPFGAPSNRPCHPALSSRP
ncbi:hypothetical protein LUW74_18760 [Actinomadura madurae]|nr:hypothetical protein [Actinomadura madurae]URN05152.1 hypothetical protein LUW74_18760 [Actinomadura madurae]